MASGTLFRVTLSGREVVLYSFGQTFGFCCTTPPGNLIVGSDGNFYGKIAGHNGDLLVGGVWGITPNGVEFLEVPFGGGADSGDFATQGGVIQASDGLLYGTQDGSVFALTTSGAGGTVPGSYCGGDCPTGASPEASLVETRDGYLYGTATQGGDLGEGTVFRTTLGTVQVNPIVAIYSFGAQSGDPTAPEFSLVEGADGNLYGTSSLGGSPNALCPQGCGTVFKVTPAGTETVLHSFGASGTDGQRPSGSLLLGSDGNLYGVTSSGGSNANCKNPKGCGTLYRITPSGVETVLYSFGTTAGDGINPSGALIQASDGHLYGTSFYGGTANTGTVFRLDLVAN
jgi:uncharacterized repeat protein (TIGR03803 family)